MRSRLISWKRVHRTTSRISLLFTMYSSSFNRDLRPRQYLDQNRLCPSPTPVSGMGGWAMNRNYSDKSSTSTQSRSSGDFYSPAGSSPSMSYELNTSQSPRYYDDGYSQEYNNYTTASPSHERSLQMSSSSVKSTPSSLDWSPKTELLRLYKLIVPKGKEPYLELLPGYQACYNTPQRVFLDQPRQVSVSGKSLWMLIHAVTLKRVFTLANSQSAVQENNSADPRI